MGDRLLNITGPLISKPPSWCTTLLSDSRFCRTGSLSLTKPVTTGLNITLKPELSRFLSLTARPKPAKQVHWAWNLAIAFSRLVKSMDIDIRNMAMNGRSAGCHCREAAPIPHGKTRSAITQCFYRPRSPNPKGCDTHYSAGTETHARLEIRPVAGTNVSRAYRFWVHYTKPLKHMFKGILPIKTFGFFGKIGPNWNNMGTMCSSANLGPFDDAFKRCAAYERRFGVPFHGSIPRNWVSKYGRLAYALDYPFNLRGMFFTKGFLGVWGMVDRATYRRMGIPYMTFPTRIDHIVELLSTIDQKRATHVNRNKPYKVTGRKPHIEWLDLHNARIDILLKDGTINIPGLTKLVFNRTEYLREANLDRHPRLLRIAREWRQFRKGGLRADPARAKQLAVEYYRERALIAKNVNRIEIRGTRKALTVTIYNPAITSLELPAGTGRLKATGLSLGKIVITMPAVADMISRRRHISETSVRIEGMTARKIAFTDRTRGIALSADDLRIGSIDLNQGRTLTVSHIDATKWSFGRTDNGLSIASGYTYIGRIRAQLTGQNRGVSISGLDNAAIHIGSKLFALKLKKSRMRGIAARAHGRSQRFSIKHISTDIETGRIGSVAFGKINIGAGSIGRGILRRGSVDISKINGVLQADIGGIFDIVVNKTVGSRLDLNVPGLEVSGTLGNIRVKGPAHFTLTPRSWDLSKLSFSGGDAPRLLSLNAQLTGARVLHDPTVRDPRMSNNPNRRVIKTRMNFTSANLSIADISRISFLLASGTQTRRSQFHHFAAHGIALTNIRGNGEAWIKAPPWQYLRAHFRNLLGSIHIADIQIKQNGHGKRSRFQNLAIDFRERAGLSNRCLVKIPLLQFSHKKYFIGDPNGKPLKLNCHFDARLRGGYFHFRSKRRPTENRRPYR